MQRIGYWALAALGVAAVLLVGGAFLGWGGAGGNEAEWDMPYMHGSVGWPGGLLMLAAMAALAIGVVLGIVWLIQRSSGQPSAPHSSAEPDALEIARRRYARGEISREEFQRLSDDLGSGSRQSG